MDFLELVQATISESSSGVGTRVRNFDDLRHDDSLVVSFVRQAWLKIQESQKWLYNRHTFEFVLQDGVREYAPSAMRDSEGHPSIPVYPNPDGTPVVDDDDNRVAADSVRRWIFTALDRNPAWALTDLGTPGPAGPASYGGHIENMMFSQFRRLYLTRPASTIPEGKPVRFAAKDIEPKSILIHPTPNASDRYIIYGECQRSSQILNASTDVPFGLPEEYHDLIKWRAIMLKSIEEQDSNAYMGAKVQYDEIHKDAVGDLAPAWGIAEALGSGGAFDRSFGVPINSLRDL